MVQWMLRDMLDLDVMTVTGKTLGENIQGARNLDTNAIRPVSYTHLTLPTKRIV